MSSGPTVRRGVCVRRVDVDVDIRVDPPEQWHLKTPPRNMLSEPRGTPWSWRYVDAGGARGKVALTGPDLWRIPAPLPVGRQSAMVARGGRGSGRVNRYRAHGVARHDYAKHTGRKLEHHKKVRLGGLDHVHFFKTTKNMQWCSDNSKVAGRDHETDEACCLRSVGTFLPKPSL